MSDRRAARISLLEWFLDFELHPNVRHSVQAELSAALATPPAPTEDEPRCTFPGCTCAGTLPRIPTDPAPTDDATLDVDDEGLPPRPPSVWYRQGWEAGYAAANIDAARVSAPITSKENK